MNTHFYQVRKSEIYTRSQATLIPQMENPSGSASARKEVWTLLNDLPSSPSKAKIHFSKTLTKFDFTRISNEGALSKHKLKS